MNEDGQEPGIVSITYDDGLASQYHNAVPELQSWELPATFFVPIMTATYPIEKWLEIPRAFEIGNHTVDHPTPRSFGLNPPYLEDYSRSAFMVGVHRAQRLLTGFGRPAPVSFSYPCYTSEYVHTVGKKKINIATEIRKLRLYGRGGDSGPPTAFDRVDLARVPAWDVHKHGMSKTMELISAVEMCGGWFVLVFHGVHGDYLDAGEAHALILSRLARSRDRRFSAKASHNRVGLEVLTFGDAARKVDAFQVRRQIRNKLVAPENRRGKR